MEKVFFLRLIEDYGRQIRTSNASANNGPQLSVKTQKLLGLIVCIATLACGITMSIKAGKSTDKNYKQFWAIGATVGFVLMIVVGTYAIQVR